ncbi:MAG: aminoacyl-tRNA hydrolase [bacterium]|nr:aminoacyl-tRNA hydrolase [bacterium]
MTLIVGLGNPGTKYDGTRHNVGFVVVDAIAGDDAWRKKRLLHAEICERDIHNVRVMLVKPTTYMNESGRTVAALLRNLKRSPADVRLIVVSDDLDLPVGTVRVRDTGSSGGHKGIASIIAHLKTQDFTRIRIGIGPNETPDGHRIPAEQFVLQRFNTEERMKIDTAIPAAITTIEERLAGQ